MIHDTAIIDATATIAKGVCIGPYTVIGPNVEIGDGCQIGPHVVISQNTKLGKNNRVYQFASLGENPQDLKYNGEQTFLEIGDSNIIRESVTINRGTVQDKALTIIGSHNLFMANVHIGHDCVIGNHVVFGHATGMSGHVVIEDHVIFSGFCGVHQFCRVGAHSFIANATLVRKDVPPYVMLTGGINATACGINAEGLKRHHYTSDQIDMIKNLYKIIYRQSLRHVEAIEKLRQLVGEHEIVRPMLYFLENSKRGIVR